jgi:anti-sigma factor RsiW
MERCEKKYSYFAYLEGALTPSEREAFERHLSGCSRCQENIFLVQELLFKVEKDKTLTASPYTLSRIMGRIEQNRISEARFRKWQPAIISLVSIAAIVAGMLIGNYFYKNTAQYSSYLNLNETQQEIIELSLLDNN